jgi:hypothetical protein
MVGEFELPVTTALREGKVIFTVANGLDEFKDSFKGFDKWKHALPIKPKKQKEVVE